MNDFRLLTITVLTLGTVACASPESSESNQPTTSGGESPETLSLIQQLNQQARQGATVDTLHGQEVADPFRQLETESEFTTRWIDAQTERTTAALETWRDPGAAERLDELLSIGTVGGARLAGERVFYSKREGDREQPLLLVHSQNTNTPEALIDPESYGERASLDFYFPSPSGRFLAFGISENGDERSVLRIMNVDTREMLDAPIAHTKWTDVAWLPDESGFYYRRYPREGEESYDAAQEDTYHLNLFFHALGSNPDEDPLVFRSPERTNFPGATVSHDGRYVVINNFRGWSASDVFLLDRGDSPRERVIRPDETHPLQTIVAGRDHLYSGEVHRAKLYITTNDGASRYRVVGMPADAPTSPEQWEDVVPEGEHAIEGVLFAGDHMVIHRIANIASEIGIHQLNGERLETLQLPGDGSVSGLSADLESGAIAFGFSSFVHPPTLYRWNGNGPALVEIDHISCDFDFENFQVSRANATSADGTPINVYYVHRRDMTRDGSHRVLLTGYGGFNISLLPGFQRNALYWVERGGVFAVANLRGGSEFGEAWHRAGNLDNKERVFEDFEAVIRWFGNESGISQPEQIAIMGGSNGGLLVGALVTRAPETFAAAIANVGLYDMVRYHRFPPAELWITEYGSADNADQFPWLHAYSPYHQVRADAPYPAVLITTADHDTRVHWAHSTKFAARLQEAAGGADPNIYFYLSHAQGHGAGTRRSDTVARYVRTYSFVEHFLGLREDPQN